MLLLGLAYLSAAFLTLKWMQALWRHSEQDAQGDRLLGAQVARRLLDHNGLTAVRTLPAAPPGVTAATRRVS